MTPPEAPLIVVGMSLGIAVANEGEQGGKTAI